MFIYWYIPNFFGHFFTYVQKSNKKWTYGMKRRARHTVCKTEVYGFRVSSIPLSRDVIVAYEDLTLIELERNQSR